MANRARGEKMINNALQKPKIEVGNLYQIFPIHEKKPAYYRGYLKP